MVPVFGGFTRPRPGTRPAGHGAAACAGPWWRRAAWRGPARRGSARSGRAARGPRPGSGGTVGARDRARSIAPARRANPACPPGLGHDDRVQTPELRDHGLVDDPPAPVIEVAAEPVDPGVRPEHQAADPARYPRPRISMMLPAPMPAMVIVATSPGRRPARPSHCRSSIRSASPAASIVRRAKSRGPGTTSEAIARGTRARATRAVGKCA